MKKTVIIFMFAVLLMACTRNKPQYSGFADPQGLEKAVVVQTASPNPAVIKPENPVEYINASDIIEEVRFIPIETTPESLIMAYCKVVIYDNKIYILDHLRAEEVFIFDMNGKFIKHVGNKGGGPEEYFLLKGMCIDRNDKRLVVYDNGKRKMMYYDLNGNFIKKNDVPYRMSGDFDILPSGNMVSITSMSDGNFHLNDYNKYRLVFTDTLGNMRKFGFEFDDNINLAVRWSKIFYNSNGELLFNEQYTNSIYQITDTRINEKYRIDCSNFTPFDVNMVTKFNNMDEFDDYWYRKTNLAPYMAENSTHLYFAVHDKTREYKYFYDTRTGKHTGYRKMNYDTDFFEVSGSMFFGYNDYFIGNVSPADLIEMKKKRIAEGNPFSKDVSMMIDALQNDDNDVLVLFKIKKL